MKIHFTFTPKFGHNLRDILWELLDNEDFMKYLKHMVDVPIRMEMKSAVKKNTKQALYDYYYGPLMAVAIQVYTNAGYELMDEVKCDYLLKCVCAKGIMMTPEGEKVYLMDKSKMPKDRLVKFVNDVIIHLIHDFGIDPEQIPDAEMYKNLQEMGGRFQSVKHKKN